MLPAQRGHPGEVRGLEEEPLSPLTSGPHARETPTAGTGECPKDTDAPLLVSLPSGLPASGEGESSARGGAVQSGVASEREDQAGAQEPVEHHVLHDDGQHGNLDLLVRLRSALLGSDYGPSGLDVVPSPDPDGRILAAALVLLYPWQAPGDDEVFPYLVLTRRTTALRRHSGQISLPGGRYDLEDGSLLRTALRETEEELGVPPSRLEVWGRLEPVWITVTGYLLAAFVAYTPRRPDFRPAPAEVAEVIEMPLSLLLDPASLAEELWEMSDGPRHVGFYRHGEHKIWGATGRILTQLAALLDPDSRAPSAFPGTADPTGRPRLLPGEVWPPRQPPHRPGA